MLELSAAMIVEIDFQGKEGKEIESEEWFWRGRGKIGV